MDGWMSGWTGEDGCVLQACPQRLESVRVRITGSRPAKGMPVLSVARQRGSSSGGSSGAQNHHTITHHESACDQNVP
eukprot:355668-Chlamydomonas_euryale.AAC.7